MRKIIPAKGKLVLKPLQEKQMGRVLLPNAITTKNLFEVVETYKDSIYKIGDHVIPKPYQGINIEIEKEEYVICHEDDILGYLE